MILLSNLDNVAARCDAILMEAASSAEADIDWTTGLQMQDIRVNIQSTDSQRIAVIRERERELAAALSISLVRLPSPCVPRSLST